MPRADEAVIPPPCRTFDIQTLLFLLAAAIFLYAFLFVPPFIPVDYNIDGLTLVTDGKRMYEGQMMYRDFFQFMTPGTVLVYFFLFKLFGHRIWIPHLALLFLGLGLAWLGVVIARKLVRPGLALLPSAIFLAGVYKNRLDPTHHWYSLLTALAAIAALVERRTPARIAAAGFFCGLTAWFTQTRGLAAVMGFCVFLWWESRQRREGRREWLKQEAWLVGGFLATLIALNAYFVWKAGLARFLWCTVIFGIKYYPKTPDNTFGVVTSTVPPFTSLRVFLFNFIPWLFLYGVIPFTHLLFFVRYRRESGKKPTDFWVRPMLLAIVGSFMFVSVAPSPSLNRMFSNALPGVILLIWFIDSPSKVPRALAAGLVAGVLLLVPHAVLSAQSKVRQIVTTRPGILLATDPWEGEVLVWMREHTRPAEYLYAPSSSGAQGVYFYMDLRNPTPLPFIQNNGYTPPQQVAEVIHALEQNPVRYILWSTLDLDSIPDWEDPSDDHLGPLQDYLHAHYKVAKVFRNSDAIWEKKN